MGDTPLHLYLLTAAPTNSDLRNSIEQIIKSASSAKVQVDFVHEYEAEAFALTMQHKMEAAGHE